MEITTYNHDGTVGSAKEVSIELPSQVECFDDSSIFYSFSEDFVLKPDLKHHEDWTYFVNRLQFLIRYDYTLYCKSSLADSFQYGKFDSDADIHRFVNNIMNIGYEGANKQDGSVSVFDSFFQKFFSNMSLATPKDNQFEFKYEKDIAKKKGLLYLKAIRIIKSFYDKNKADIVSPMDAPFATDKRANATSTERESLIAFLQPFVSCYKQNCNLSNESFVVAVGKALYLTGGKRRSFLFRLIHILNGICLGDTYAIHAKNTVLCYQEDKEDSFQIEGITRTIRLDSNTCIKYTISECATIIGATKSLSNEDLKRIAEDLQIAYEKFKSTNQNLKLLYEKDCRIQTNSHGKLYKETWKEYKKELTKYWKIALISASTATQLIPMLCFYKLILLHDDNIGGFTKSLIEDFFTLCITNKTVDINPDLFSEMFRMEYINMETRISDELLTNKDPKILSISKESCSSDLFTGNIEPNIAQNREDFIDTVKRQVIGEYKEFLHDTDGHITDLCLALNHLATDLNNGVQPNKFDKVGWGVVYEDRISTINKELECNRTEAPNCYYQILMQRERPSLIIDWLDSKLLHSLANCLIDTGGQYRLLLYKTIYILNYIKEQQGYVSSEVRLYDYAEDDSDSTIKEVLKFLKPMINASYINPDVLTPEGFRGLLKSIFHNDRVLSNLKKIQGSSKEAKTPFNASLVFLILGIIYNHQIKRSDGTSRFIFAAGVGCKPLSIFLFNSSQYIWRDSLRRIMSNPQGKYFTDDLVTFIHSEMEKFYDFDKVIRHHRI